jgi:hypothetical protein
MAGVVVVYTLFQMIQALVADQAAAVALMVL